MKYVIAAALIGIAIVMILVGIAIGLWAVALPVYLKLIIGGIILAFATLLIFMFIEETGGQ